MNEIFLRAERILSSKEVLKIIPYSPSHIWRMEQQGRFPRRVKLGANRVGWLESELSNWIKARADERVCGEPSTTNETTIEPNGGKR